MFCQLWKHTQGRLSAKQHHCQTHLASWMAARSGEVRTKNMTAFGTPSAQDCDLHGHSAGFVIEKIILFSVTITGYLYRQNPPKHHSLPFSSRALMKQNKSSSSAIVGCGPGMGNLDLDLQGSWCKLWTSPWTGQQYPTVAWLGRASWGFSALALSIDHTVHPSQPQCLSFVWQRIALASTHNDPSEGPSSWGSDKPG